MLDPENKQNNEPSEDKGKEGAALSNQPEKPADDSFKTPDKDHRLGWEEPMDEQMHDRTSPDSDEE